MTTERHPRMQAEWEPHHCVLMAWPHALTDWQPLLDEARACVAAIVRAISRHECVLLAGPADGCLDSIKECGFDASRVRFADVPTNDTWARDFGPLAIETATGAPALIDFKFNAWGMKFAADRDNLICSRLTAKDTFACAVANRQDFVLEGGSVETDGHGTLLTTAECLLSPNRNGALDENAIRSALAQALGFTHQLWLRHGGIAGDDTDSHIDTLARLAPEDCILYVGATDSQGVTVHELELMRDELAQMRTPSGQPYNLIELPLPDPIYDEEGMQLPATYANYLVSPSVVYLPVYGQPSNDRRAADTLRIAYPGHEIVSLDCRALIKQHGSLHCITMQLPEGTVAGIDPGNCTWLMPLRNLD